MAEYDNDNTGVVFPPFPEQRFILQGNLNIEGTDHRVALVKSKTKTGKEPVEIYVKVGAVFPVSEDKKKSDKSPDYYGSLEGLFPEFFKISGWRKTKEQEGQAALPYMSLSIRVDEDEKNEQQGNQPQNTQEFASSEIDDEIPF